MVSVATSSFFEHSACPPLSVAWPTKRHFHCESQSDSHLNVASTADLLLSDFCCVSSGNESRESDRSIWSSESGKQVRAGVPHEDVFVHFKNKNRDARRRQARLKQADYSAYQTYAVDCCGGKRQTPPLQASTQELMMTKLRTTPSAAATPSTPREQCGAATTTTTTLSRAPNDLAASSSAERLHGRAKSTVRVPPKRVVTNVLAYWLSLVYETESRNRFFAAKIDHLIEKQADSVAFVPPYLRESAFLRSKLHNLCWQCGGSANDYVGALAIVDSIRDHHSPAQLQAAVRAFINALGTETVHAYMVRKGVWSALSRRYQTTMQAQFCAAQISERLRAMNSAAMCL